MSQVFLMREPQINPKCWPLLEIQTTLYMWILQDLENHEPIAVYSSLVLNWPSPWNTSHPKKLFLGLTVSSVLLYRGHSIQVENLDKKEALPPSYQSNKTSLRDVFVVSVGHEKHSEPLFWFGQPIGILVQVDNS